MPVKSGITEISMFKKGDFTNANIVPSYKVAKLTTGIFMKVARKQQEMINQGKDVIDLSVGSLVFTTTSVLKIYTQIIYMLKILQNMDIH